MTTKHGRKTGFGLRFSATANTDQECDLGVRSHNTGNENKVYMMQQKTKADV